EVEFALPIELTLDQQRVLVDDFAKYLTEVERLPYTLALDLGQVLGEVVHEHPLLIERQLDWQGKFNLFE
ncbi:MobA/MobL family protein, partial [Aeromonas caviae]|uniref:MobA/MobL family protein n=1 Tax=Aeromonas caviae TaxID=648 RepID=UPI001CC41914